MKTGFEAAYGGPSDGAVGGVELFGLRPFGAKTKHRQYRRARYRQSSGSNSRANSVLLTRALSSWGLQELARSQVRTVAIDDSVAFAPITTLDKLRRGN